MIFIFSWVMKEETSRNLMGYMTNDKKSSLMHTVSYILKKSFCTSVLFYPVEWFRVSYCLDYFVSIFNMSCKILHSWVKNMFKTMLPEIKHWYDSENFWEGILFLNPHRTKVCDCVNLTSERLYYLKNWKISYLP